MQQKHNHNQAAVAAAMEVVTEVAANPLSREPTDQKILGWK